MLMTDAIVTAFMALGGTLTGLIVKDVGMALVLARRKRREETEERDRTEAVSRHDLVRVYLDPLEQSATSLSHRLSEIINEGPARYLLSGTHSNEYVDYKRLSTFYRLARLLGWIRAFSRERAYLDPARAEIPGPIKEIEAALADGQHIETRRLDELLRLWGHEGAVIDAKARLGAEIDAEIQNFLSANGRMSASELDSSQVVALALQCAKALRERSALDIPDQTVQGTAIAAGALFGIKEAYIYRDWQAAIGDMMLTDLSGAARRFDVIGYGEFERRYLEARTTPGADRRWFDRLDLLFHDLDMSKSGPFDARRDQVKRLLGASNDLASYLVTQRSELQVKPARAKTTPRSATSP